MEYDKVVTMAGIYIHIPFCRQKCNYCNFFSLATTRFRDEFFRALLKEIELTRDYLGDEPVETIYFGGGTPSLFPEDQVGKILDAIGDVHLTPELQLPPNPLKGAYSASREDLTPNPSPQGEGSKSLLGDLGASNIRFIRFRVSGLLQNPDWHPSAGGACWVFVDEVVVR